jgi:7-cyano-7-deazaguanine synthase in queuosine biosynthesis
MKTWHIVLKTNSNDTYDYDCSESEQKIIVVIGSYADNNSIVRTHVLEYFEDENIYPTRNAYDLLNIGLNIYAADQIVSREIDGFQNWSRHFILHAPVHNLTEWETIKNDFENLLSFLSGDKWEIRFRQHTKIIFSEKRTINNPNKLEIVSLLSGGLDSYIGAINLLESGKKVAFISHYKGGTAEKSAQDKLYGNFSSIYKKNPHQHYQFFVQPNQTHSLAIKEDTSRCRSIIFMVLGIAVASSLGEDIKVNVPENGFISLNVPLTPTRLSSHSTRTTHPFYMNLFNKILNTLNIKVELINPYRFKTKGEMILECSNKEIIKSNFKFTVSCAHPDQARWEGKTPGMSCGYCTPCIIRRAALKRANLHENEYAVDILNQPPTPTGKKGRDLRAFKLSIERFKKLNNITLLSHIFSSGPIPFSDKSELNNYVGIYTRGIKEVSDFLSYKI